MSDSENLFEELLRRLGLDSLPTFQQILNSMDPFLWTLVLLLTGAVILGVFFCAEHSVPFSRFSGGGGFARNASGPVEARSNLPDAAVNYQPTWGRLDLATPGVRRPDHRGALAIQVESSTGRAFGTALGSKCVWPGLRFGQLLPVRRYARAGQHAHSPHSADPQTGAAPAA